VDFSLHPETAPSHASINSYAVDYHRSRWDQKGKLV
jgi:hypothetical protein